MSDAEDPKIEMKTAKPRFINPPNRLKAKVGDGGIPSGLLNQGQEFIETNPINFEPYAHEFLRRIEEAMNAVRKADTMTPQLHDQLNQPVMELKANGGMFQYYLVSMIADVVLQFLENVENIDEDALDIVKAHNKTLVTILNSRLKGDGGREGAALTKELLDACTRYYKKHNIEL